MTYNQLSKDDVNKKLVEKKLEVLDDYVSTKEIATFRCLICGKEFKTKYDFTRKWKYPGCDECRKQFKLIKSKEKRERHRKEMLNERLSKYVEILSHTGNEYTCKCLMCGEIYNTSYDSLLQGCMHKSCASKIANMPIRLSIQDIQKMCDQNNMHLTLECEDDNGSITYHCNVCGYKGIKKRSLLMKKRGCPECGKFSTRLSKCNPVDNISYELQKYNLRFIERVENNLLPITEHTKVIVQCNKCLSQFITSLGYIKRYNIICVTCQKSERLLNSFNKSKKYILSINPHLHFEYDESYNYKELDILCDECGRSFKKMLSVLKMYPNCPYCTTNSVLEYRVSHYLKDNKIDYIHTYRFEDLRGVNDGQLSYDFYLPDYNILIECQGVQHERPIEYFGGDDQFYIQQEHDKRKRKYAEQHKINLVEIWYYEANNINQILDNILNICNRKRTA